MRPIASNGNRPKCGLAITLVQSLKEAPPTPRELVLAYEYSRKVANQFGVGELIPEGQEVVAANDRERQVVELFNPEVGIRRRRFKMAVRAAETAAEEQRQAVIRDEIAERVRIERAERAVVCSQQRERLIAEGGNSSTESESEQEPV